MSEFWWVMIVVAAAFAAPIVLAVVAFVIGKFAAYGWALGRHRFEENRAKGRFKRGT